MNPIVKTTRGSVRGISADGVSVFKGIPYAAPPFGDNRLRPPQSVTPWSGVRDAFDFGAKPAEVPYPPPWDILLPELDKPGEDCLTLNIWSSALGPIGQPVIVWIPGGMFESGTSAMAAYDGSEFARDGIVCVTINYRVGAEGFLYLGKGHANLGLLDQVAALEWVRDNIDAFGGDPAKVTVMGESAGAISVGILLSMPRAEGLFHRAIVQSGGAHEVLSVASAELVAQRFAEKVGVPATRDALAEVPVERTLQASAELKNELLANRDPALWGIEVLLSNALWQPVIDGEIIPARPIDRIEAGAGADVDILAGSNVDEWNFFTVPGGMIDMVTDETLPTVVAAYGLPVESTLAAYRAAHPGAGPGELLSLIQSDWYFRIPTLRLAEAHAKSRSSSTYMYEFAWRSPKFDGRLGACHGLEIPFVFETIEGGDDPLLGPNPPLRLADTMHAAWTAFAIKGECGWPKFDLGRRATMRFDVTPEVIYDPRATERAIWEGRR